MIYDNLCNFEKYVSLNKNFNDVARFLAGNNIQELCNPRYEINDTTFALISEYNTKNISESFIEYHKKYIDIQIVLKGKEQLGFCDFESAKSLTFDDEKEFGKLEGVQEFVKLEYPKFAILFPYEGHTPQLNFLDSSEHVKKMVIKVPNIL